MRLKQRTEFLARSMVGGETSGTKLNAAKCREKALDENEKKMDLRVRVLCWHTALEYRYHTGNSAQGTVAIYSTLAARLHNIMILLQE